MTTDQWQWTDARELCVEGQGWTETEGPYDRLPSRAKGLVRDEVWNLSRQPAGLTVRFETDAAEIRARWELGSDSLYHAHCPLLAHSGLDLYARTDKGQWRWVGVTREIQGCRAEASLTAGELRPGRREFMLYLPLNNPLLALQIGIPAGAMIGTLPPRTVKPIVCYGTSIVHGLGVSRPGMTHLAILARRLDYPVINLGFAGQAQMEPAVAELLAELDAALFIVDPVPNMEPAWIAERAEPIMRRLSTARSGVPIVLVEDRSYPAGWLTPELAARNASRRESFKQAYAKLLLAGIGPLRYLEGDGLLGIDGDGTSDGSHPNDLGAGRMTDALEPVLRPLLGLPA